MDEIADDPQTPELPTFDIHAEMLPEVDKRVDKVNRRLARAGGTESFSYTITRRYTLTESATGTERLIPRVVIELSAPRISAAGHTFVASLTKESGGMIVRTVPGEDLSGWTRPEDHYCEYCNSARSRAKSYVVRNDETGDFIQIGRNCVAPFLGMVPALWMLTLDPESLIPDEDDWITTCGGSAPSLYDVRTLLAAAWSVSNEGKAFVTAGVAREWGKTSTAGEALEVIDPPSSLMRKPEYQAKIQKAQAQAAAVPAQVIDELIAAGRGVDPSTDYGQNLAVALDSGQISRRSAGLVASIIAVYNRQQSRLAEQAARPVELDEWLGEPKTKLEPCTVTMTHVFENPGYAYNTVTTTMIMRADSGHILKWRTAGEHEEYQVGYRFHLHRATVKEHDTYRDRKQTVVLRCKLERIDDEDQPDKDQSRHPA
ncbi:hypothetical protein [Gordonia sihwensis]|uniref:hypothetical protein n=1 Tax=Gordonia sihwensis TaxID=173559 RepID=UPI003D9847A7